MIGVVLSFWAPHISHVPLEVPKLWYDRFGDLQDGDVDMHARQIYEAMTNFADTALLNVTLALKAKPQDRGEAQGAVSSVSMWDKTLLVFTSDNGTQLPRFQCLASWADAPSLPNLTGGPISDNGTSGGNLLHCVVLATARIRPYNNRGTRGSVFCEGRCTITV